MPRIFRQPSIRLNRFSAIKPDEASFWTLREGVAISQLNHSNICTLYDVGRHEDVDYLVMEYLEGETLAKRLSKGPLPVADALRYGIGIAAALEAAHERGITHRDVKPGNIMLLGDSCKLLDFGLAKLQRCYLRNSRSKLKA
jgi:eukaryotic-like serine/threonine-protein kinase